MQSKDLLEKAYIPLSQRAVILSEGRVATGVEGSAFGVGELRTGVTSEVGNDPATTRIQRLISPIRQDLFRFVTVVCFRGHHRGHEASAPRTEHEQCDPKGQFADCRIQGVSWSGWNHQDTNVRKVKASGAAYLPMGSPTRT